MNSMDNVNVYTPPFYLENGFVQTFLASSKIRTLGKNEMVRAAREIILETHDGIRLLGYLSVKNKKNPKGLVILLHGWEGSSDSTYILTTGRDLFQRGYDVFRLNFRDHGDSHHLNRGIFYAVLLEEVFGAVCQIGRKYEHLPIFVMGFSLGGNFALRLAKRALEDPIENLKHVVAVSPVLDPDKATDKIDDTLLIKMYFLKKWKRSLRKKQQLFPDLYDFSNIIKVRSIRRMTEKLLEKYSNYDSAGAYFKAYSMVDGDLKDVTLPMHIITAEDDPIIPVEDFYRLSLNPATRLMVQAHGGHNGFINGKRLCSWYETIADRIFSRYAHPG